MLASNYNGDDPVISLLLLLNPTIVSFLLRESPHVID